jgi:uncharacterized protein with PQ loop repeat
MGIIASLVILVACVKLLNVTSSPGVATGVFVVCKVAIVLFVGAGFLTALIYAGIAALVGFGFFWLLNRLQGSALWWAALMIGVLLLI